VRLSAAVRLPHAPVGDAAEDGAVVAAVPGALDPALQRLEAVEQQRGAVGGAFVRQLQRRQLVRLGAIDPGRCSA
jgi:hypothetical protein